MKDIQNLEPGIIYIVKNTITEENIFKVGFTTKNVQKRFSDSWKKSSPSAFSLERGSRVVAIYAVFEPRKIESEIHNALSKYKRPEGKEWFKIELTRLKDIIEQIIGKSRENTVREINEPSNEEISIKESENKFNEIEHTANKTENLGQKKGEDGCLLGLIKIFIYALVILFILIFTIQIFG